MWNISPLNFDTGDKNENINTFFWKYYRNTTKFIKNINKKSNKYNWLIDYIFSDLALKLVFCFE